MGWYTPEVEQCRNDRGTAAVLHQEPERDDVRVEILLPGAGPGDGEEVRAQLKSSGIEERSPDERSTDTHLTPAASSVSRAVGVPEASHTPDLVLACQLDRHG